jgi:hypothetical protein
MLNIQVNFIAGLFRRHLCIASAFGTRTDYKSLCTKTEHKSCFGFMN